MRQSTSLTLRPELLGYTLGFNQFGMGAIAHRILPPLVVNKRVDSIDTIAATEIARLESTRRAPGSAWPRGSTGFDTTTYTCKQYAFSDANDRTVQADRPDLANEETSAVMSAGVLLRGYEKIVADAVINETNFPASGTTGASLSTAWDTYATSTPGADVSTGIAALRGKFGVGGESMSLVLPWRAWRLLPFAADVRARLQITTEPFPGQLSPQALANYFGVGEVLVGGMTYNSAGQGVASATLAEIWNDDYAFLFIKRQGTGPASLRQPHLGTTFTWDWNGMVADQWPADGGSVPFSVMSYEDNGTNSDVVVAEHCIDPKFLWSTAGYLIKNIKA